MFVRAYLRASTKEQDANRAKDELIAFANQRSLKIAAFYSENESGASLARPELIRLLQDSQAGDILLIEKVDRLSRLSSADWNVLKDEIKNRQIRIVALDLPTSWSMAVNNVDDVTQRIFEAINSMLLDVIAAIAHKDYIDRRHRQMQGIKKAKEKGLYRGRPENKSRNDAIQKMISDGHSWNAIIAATGCSRSTISRLRKRLKQL